MRPPWHGLFVVALTAATAFAEAGAIRGQLRVPGPSAQAATRPNPYPGRAGVVPSTGPAARPAVADAVIWIERVPASVESLLAGRGSPIPQLAQKDQKFVPRVLAVAAGTTVEFPNLDPIFHNVFSVSPVKRFDLGKYPRGQSRRVTFGKPGLVQVYCDIHADMAAYILVLPNHAFTRPDEAGSFTLTDLPPGHYRLKAWHPDHDALERRVEVPEHDDVRLELSF